MSDQRIKNLKDLAKKTLENSKESHLPPGGGKANYNKILVFLGVILLGISGYYLYQNWSKNKTDNKPNPVSPIPKAIPPATPKIDSTKIYLELAKNKTKDFFEGINKKDVTKLNMILKERLIKYNDWENIEQAELIQNLRKYWARVPFEQDLIDYETFEIKKNTDKNRFLITSFNSTYKFKTKSGVQKEYERVNTLIFDKNYKISFFSSRNPN